MRKSKLLLGILTALVVLAAQAGPVRAAPMPKPLSPVSGIVQRITLETNPNTGISIVIVSLLDEDSLVHEVRLSLESALSLGIIIRDADGNPMINESALGLSVEIEAHDQIPANGAYRHPVGNALAKFFGELSGLDYDVIMNAHGDGTGFGVIAQALWLTTQLDGDADLFLQILEARQTNDYSGFVLEDGSSPMNWGQFRKAILDQADQNNLGIVVSDQENGNGPEDEKRSPNGNGPPEDRPGKGNEKDKGNNGNGKGKDK